jgi:choline-glycine betaine transporter
MNSRAISFGSLALATSAVLGALTLAYGLVYPSGAHDSKLPLAIAIVAGALCAQSAALLGFRTYRRARSEPDRFFALLVLATSAFFLFVVVFGFGIPALVLGVHD